MTSQTHPSDMAVLVERALRDALDHYERNVCHHEDTHRGGVLWTICDQCGAKWADDEGGFKPFEYPPEIVRAQEVLQALSADQRAGQEEALAQGLQEDIAAIDTARKGSGQVEPYLAALAYRVEAHWPAILAALTKAAPPVEADLREAVAFQNDARVLLNLHGVTPAKWSGEEVRRMFDLISRIAYSQLPQDVIRLVIAARMIAWEDRDPANIKELQEASEAFASRVPWEDEPEDGE